MSFNLGLVMSKEKIVADILLFRANGWSRKFSEVQSTHMYFDSCLPGLETRLK